MEVVETIDISEDCDTIANNIDTSVNLSAAVITKAPAQLALDSSSPPREAKPEQPIVPSTVETKKSGSKPNAETMENINEPFVSEENQAIDVKYDVQKSKENCDVPVSKANEASHVDGNQSCILAEQNELKHENMKNYVIENDPQNSCISNKFNETKCESLDRFAIENNFLQNTTVKKSESREEFTVRNYEETSDVINETKTKELENQDEDSNSLPLQQQEVTHCAKEFFISDNNPSNKVREESYEGQTNDTDSEYWINTADENTEESDELKRDLTKTHLHDEELRQETS